MTSDISGPVEGYKMPPIYLLLDLTSGRGFVTDVDNDGKHAKDSNN
jgi:hypothetical protein